MRLSDQMISYENDDAFKKDPKFHVFCDGGNGLVNLGFVLPILVVVPVLQAKEHFSALQCVCLNLSARWLEADAFADAGFLGKGIARVLGYLPMVRGRHIV